MATIYPFCPLRPDPLLAEELLFHGQPGDDAVPEGPPPLKALLESAARKRPETVEAQALAYAEIREAMTNLLAHGVLSPEESEGIFVYEVSTPGYRQTGVWALTDLEDYRTGRIRVHELTLADSVRRMRNYRAETGLEGAPMLLAYPPDKEINGVIRAVKTGRPVETFGNREGWHRVWKIKSKELQQKVMRDFQKVKKVYLADGHHRLESALRLATEQRESALPVFDRVSSLYIATDELAFEPYDRVVFPIQAVLKEQIFQQLLSNFHLLDSRGNAPVRPGARGQIGMCIEGQWYHLLPKSTALGCGAFLAFDTAVLQEQVLCPLFGIQDPQRDGRLKCIGGGRAMEEIDELCTAHPSAVAFTLFPLGVQELMDAADAGIVLPPKSTWIVPKVPYGLLIHQHEIN